MDNISKLTIYDFLTMMVPGALIMMLLEPVPEKGSSLIIWSILCYLVGLIYHCIIEYLWNKLCFRNNNQSVSGPLFSPAKRKGEKDGIPLYKFLKGPMIRRFGEDWYERFVKQIVR